MDVRETELDIKNGNVTIKALLTGSWQPTLFIQMHSFTWDMRRAIHDRAAQFFWQRDVSYLRFNLYDFDKDARNLSDHDLTIESHVSDLRAVIAFARSKGVKNIHVGGYSMSAYPAIIAGSDSSLEMSSVVLWDGSHPTKPPLKKENYLHWNRQGLYVAQKGAGYVLSKTYFDSIQAFNASKHTNAWSLPTLLLVAGEGALKDAADIYMKLLRPHAKKVVIEGANHQFYGDTALTDRLYWETATWVDGNYQAL